MNTRKIMFCVLVATTLLVGCNHDLADETVVHDGSGVVEIVREMRAGGGGSLFSVGLADPNSCVSVPHNVAVEVEATARMQYELENITPVRVVEREQEMESWMAIEGSDWHCYSLYGIAVPYWGASLGSVRYRLSGIDDESLPVRIFTTLDANTSESRNPFNEKNIAMHELVSAAATAASWSPLPVLMEGEWTGPKLDVSKFWVWRESVFLLDDGGTPSSYVFRLSDAGFKVSKPHHDEGYFFSSMMFPGERHVVALLMKDHAGLIFPHYTADGEYWHDMGIKISRSHADPMLGYNHKSGNWFLLERNSTGSTIHFIEEDELGALVKTGSEEFSGIDMIAMAISEGGVVVVGNRRAAVKGIYTNFLDFHFYEDGIWTSESVESPSGYAFGQGSIYHNPDKRYLYVEDYLEGRYLVLTIDLQNTRKALAFAEVEDTPVGGLVFGSAAVLARNPWVLDYKHSEGSDWSRLDLTDPDLMRGWSISGGYRLEDYAMLSPSHAFLLARTSFYRITTPALMNLKTGIVEALGISSTWNLYFPLQEHIYRLGWDGLHQTYRVQMLEGLDVTDVPADEIIEPEEGGAEDGDENRGSDAVKKSGGTFSVFHLLFLMLLLVARKVRPATQACG